ncbi:MAG: FAD:protein FMN transferase [Ruminococcaceae bacterium]|nr:FAD:protein FMN transferase [Oscillospiraceae bacterium]
MKAKRKTAVFSKTLAVISSFFILFTLVGCQMNNSRPFSKQDFVMDTVLTQIIYPGNDLDAEIAQEALEILKKAEKKLSAFDENSEISRVNASEGKSVEVSQETFEIVKSALEYARQSDFLFDISVLPVSSIWKTAIKDQKLPDDSKIQSAKKLVDGSKIVLDEEKRSITLEKGMGIDLGACAKGAALASVKKLYDEKEVSGAICSLGGSAMLLYGNKNGQDFKIGLKNPFDSKAQESFAILSLSDCVVSTSGGYERFAEINGEIYHHIIDIKTGYPAKNDVAFATVVGSDGVFCDYMSTRLFLEGFENACALAQKNEIAAVIVSQDKKVFVSNSLSHRLEIADGSFERIG